MVDLYYHYALHKETTFKLTIQCKMYIMRESNKAAFILFHIHKIDGIRTEYNIASR